MRILAAISGICMFAGCAVTNDAADALAQRQAKTVVNSVMQSRLPGVNISPVTDCVIEAASAREILSLAQASVTQITPQTAETVIDISTRPESVQCIAENGVLLLGG